MLTEITIEGFKSIRKQTVSLGALNLLIGANGSGKSNFISAFRFLHYAIGGNLQTYVGQRGGPENIFHFGIKRTKEMRFDIKFKGDFGSNREWQYNASFLPTTEQNLIFGSENAYGPTYYVSSYHVGLGSGHRESNLVRDIQSFKKERGMEGVSADILRHLSSWRVYHFHDTGDTALVKQYGDIRENSYLKFDASNLAAFLYWMREKKEQYYRKIVKTVRLVAPFFDDFVLRLNPLNENTIQLEWKEIGSDKLFGPDSLSDGTLRFICLATLLLQPKETMPSTIFVDEPELGLHPYALVQLAAMLQSASEIRQVIVSTQSVPLLNQFRAEDVIVVSKNEGDSTFTRLDLVALEDWINDYSLGDLWEKNVIGGRPA